MEQTNPELMRMMETINSTYIATYIFIIKYMYVCTTYIHVTVRLQSLAELIVLFFVCLNRLFYRSPIN